MEKLRMTSDWEKFELKLFISIKNIIQIGLR